MSDPSSVPPSPVGLGFCRLCARSVAEDSFESPDEHREFMITGVCQLCQRLMYAGAESNPPVSCPVLYGNVVGVVSDGPSVRSVGALPFRYDPWHAQFEWQLQHVLTAGRVWSVDPPAELCPVLCSASDPADLRVLALASCDDPLLSARLSRAHLLIVLHRLDEARVGTLLRPARLPPSAPPIPAPLTVTLTRELPLSELPLSEPFARPLGPLPLAEFLRARGLPELAGTVAACEGSVLRKCSLISRLLELPADPESESESTVFAQWLMACAD